MKEVKFMMLAIACMAVFTFSSCSDDDNFKPEEVIQAALSTKYPNATHVEWERKGTYLVADCHIDGKDVDVWFTTDGQWKMTETELLPADMPTAVIAALATTKYANWRVDDRDLLEYPSGKASEYVIEVEGENKEIDLYFSTNGEFLHEKDVTTGDDTHWPE